MDLVSSHIKQAMAELGTAQRLLDDGIYYAAIFHAQQASENAIKAVLVVRGYREIRRHIVSSLLARCVDKVEEPWKSKLSDLLPDIIELELDGTTARYSFEQEGEILVPSEAFKRSDAKRCVQMADSVVKTLTGYLKGRDIKE